jgi:hypothetical protein
MASPGGQTSRRDAGDDGGPALNQCAEDPHRHGGSHQLVPEQQHHHGDALRHVLYRYGQRRDEAQLHVVGRGDPHGEALRDVVDGYGKRHQLTPLHLIRQLRRPLVAAYEVFMRRKEVEQPDKRNSAQDAQPHLPEPPPLHAGSIKLVKLATNMMPPVKPRPRSRSLSSSLLNNVSNARGTPRRVPTVTMRAFCRNGST